MNKKIYSLLTLCLLLIASGCNHKPTYQKPQRVRSTELSYDDMPTPGKPITILVHGTRLPFPLLAVPLLSQQAITPSGLHKASKVSTFYQFCRLIHLLGECDPVGFPISNSYLFGWSGTLSFKRREESGERLYHYLRHIRDDKRFDTTPITVITVSHGANVALNIAKAAEKYKDTRCLVDRLILLCGPVQDATDRFVASPIFKQVFNVFSESDTIQVADPQQLYNEKEVPQKPQTFFSRRTFNTPSDHLIQASITYGSSKPSHFSFAMDCFYKKLPQLLNTLSDETARSRLVKKAHGVCVVDLYKLPVEN